VVVASVEVTEAAGEVSYVARDCWETACTYASGCRWDANSQVTFSTPSFAQLKS
jgi:hypothetical protein